MKEKRNAYKILVEKPHLGGLGIDGMDGFSV
jgi:hypothetical protein